MTRFGVPLAVVLFGTSAARADMGPFLPGTTLARPYHRVEVGDVPPGFVGVLDSRCVSSPALGRQSWFVELVPGTSLRWSGRHDDVAELLIVPRAVLDRYSHAGDVADAVESGAEPAVRQRFGARERVPAWAGGVVEFTYRVQAAPGGVGIEVVRTSRDPMWQWNCAALALAAALALGGLWLVRRLFRRRGPAVPV